VDDIRGLMPLLERRRAESGLENKTTARLVEEAVCRPWSGHTSPGLAVREDRVGSRLVGAVSATLAGPASGIWWRPLHHPHLGRTAQRQMPSLTAEAMSRHLKVARVLDGQPRGADKSGQVPCATAKMSSMIWSDGVTSL